MVEVFTNSYKTKNKKQEHSKLFFFFKYTPFISSHFCQMCVVCLFVWPHQSSKINLHFVKEKKLK